MIDEKKINQMENYILSMYWARNGPSPALACWMMGYFIRHAETKACVREGVSLKRGQIRIIAKEFCETWHIPQQTFRTICNKMSNTKLTSIQHQTNKRATIVTICNYSNYEVVPKRTNTKVTPNQHQSNTKVTNHKVSRAHEDNIIINNENKYNNNYYLDSQQRGGAPARGHGRPSCGEVPLLGEIASLSADEAWLEIICMNYHLSKSDVTLRLGMFRSECLASGKTEHGSIADCKSHFNNWLRVQLQNRNGNGTGRKQYATREEQTDEALGALLLLRGQ